MMELHDVKGGADQTVKLNSIIYLCIPPHVSHRFYAFGDVSSLNWLPEKTMCKKHLPS